MNTTFTLQIRVSHRAAARLMVDLDRNEDQAQEGEMGTAVFATLEQLLGDLLDVGTGVDGVEIAVPHDLAQLLDDSLTNVPSDALEDLVGQWGKS